VESIDSTAAKSRGRREIRALVQVQNEQELAAGGATVSATWTFPDGASQAVQDVTSSTGYAYFELAGRLDRGTYVLTVDDVTLADHVFDRTGSVLAPASKPSRFAGSLVGSLANPPEGFISTTPPEA
jgi:hypothetical protein